ncbi:MAG: oligosaccharide flippase family protein [Neisseriaceae bacterium]|nr:oligosaccharide flippase family protein [Neisseriaceae bacterium]
MNIIKDSVIYLIGELFAKALPFLLFPYLTRRLGVAGFGELSYWQTLFNLLLIVFSLAQDGIVARYYYFYGKRNLSNVVYAGYFYTFFLLVIGLCFAYIQKSILMGIVLSAVASQSILSTQLSIRQCQKQALPYVFIQISSGLIAVFLTVLLLELSKGMEVEKRFIAVLIGNIMVSATAWYFFQKTVFHTKININRLMISFKYIVALGLPLVFHQFALFIKGQLDRVFVYHQYSDHQLGIYAAGWQIAAVLGVVLMAINKAIVPYYYQALKQNTLTREKICQFAIKSLWLVPLPAICAYMLPEKLWLLVVGSNYQGISPYIVLFLLGYGLTLPYLILCNYLFFYGKNKQIAFLSISSSLIYLLVLILTSKISIQYIPFSMIVSNFFLMVGIYIYIKLNNQQVTQ